ncbi:gliding motility-associated C-terminal domain-containing protein [Neolewinella lacunae]|uniref:Gliding motility-associated C-terminal domain-containing protein n=1 Tax=Neolewinella lacunae TaxID=1517758 RepID=A0A923T8P1_9BACT|nr:gliding motility-associated C-terminal domain-containing protein [Neolewinella lacunae]MBC6995845.1 gliding motility-associated C-terminal domain-containing protein [Neolewinella lacunae]MDN3636462.1 gliding motility-associated C-terminal domain-containing protein [Neolewinella lacunae]
MRSFYLLVLLLLGLATPLAAQRANDECSNALALPPVLNYCSGPGALSNTGATTSFTGAQANNYGICISEPNEMHDVWFSFVAQRNSANIRVNGNIPGNVRGSIVSPQMTLYSGPCADITRDDVIVCKSPFQNLNGINAIATNLIVGETYFLLVGARNGNEGTFELCIDQFDAVPDPNSDCATGVILCDKSPFSVAFLSGNGTVRDDLQANGCVDNNCRPTEDNSAWYRWTCDQPGTLSFVITPLGAAINEDIDFAVYELTNGIDDCGARQTLRCMYSGETGGQADNLNLPCLGPTGMSDADPDTSESCGCQPGNNNFVRSIDMVAGRSYALVIFNFSASGDGFSIEFGGTGTFVGPEAAFSFSSAEVCVGDALVFEDRSTSVDQIVSREWNFGPTATPRTASGPGPHSVVFGAPGNPAVELVIETSRECREILSQREVNVICCDGQFTGTAQISDVVCPNDITGAIDLTATSSFSPTTLAFNWSNGAMTEDLNNLGLGDYTVTVSDVSGCEEVFTYTVGGPPAFRFDTLIGMPDCAGGTNGSLTFTVLAGGLGPYEYSFNGGAFSGNNVLNNLPVSTVNVVARDANGCLVDQAIDVDELELGLVQGAPVFTEPICNGDANGRIEIQLANGRPGYEYDFNLGQGFQASNVQAGLVAGTYTVNARDADGCLGNFTVELTEPTPITVAPAATDISCFGADDGSILVLTGGGRPSYTYAWSDGSSADTLRTDLPPGPYTISLTDQNGCVRSASVTINEPNEIFPVLEQATDLTCFEEPTGSFLLSATGGTPDYTYSADGSSFQADPLLGNLLAGDYRLYVMDANGCLDSLDGRLNQPVEFIIDPGNDVRIFLGFDTILRVVSNYDPVRYQWGPDSLRCLDPPCTRVSAGPFTTTLYTVIGTNAAGCRDSATVEVAVVADRPLYVPNAFSPNGDGVNDGFTIFGGRAVAEIESLRIYDRWGGLVFENENFLPNEPSLGWDGLVDGRPVNPAVFVYAARVRFVNGTVQEYGGDLTLLR